MSRRVPLTLIAALVSLLAATPGAQATSTLSAESAGTIQFHLTAEPGKANHITVTTGSNSLTIADSSDTITTSVSGCNGSGSGEVQCFSGIDFGKVTLSLGDENDALAASGTVGVYADGAGGDDSLSATGFVPFEAYGGSGSDVLNGGSGADTLAGAEGADMTHGNGGNDATSLEDVGDRAYGDGGNDLFIGAAGTSGGGLADGGAGLDEIFYLGVEPPAPAYVVDLAAGSGGSAGATDTLVSIEDALTSQGADTVTGSAGANRIVTALDQENLLPVLTGGIGGVLLDAGDIVNPLGGPDFVKTGGGNDIVDLIDGSADRLDCGVGTDIVKADQLDELTDCENVTRQTVTADSPPTQATTAQAHDTASPKCTLKGLGRGYARKRFLSGLRAQVGCDEPVTLEARLTIPASLKARKSKRGGKRHRPASASRAGDLVLAERVLGAAKSSTLRLKPVGRLRPLLGGHFKATVRIVARDAAGNATVLQRTVRVKPDRKKGKRRVRAHPSTSKAS